jgi:hypothetical protein
VYAPPPSTFRDAVEHRYVTIGSMMERNWITVQITGMLQHSCAAHGIKVVTLIDALMDDKLHTRPDFSSDEVHLSQRYWPLWCERAKGAGLF